MVFDNNNLLTLLVCIVSFTTCDKLFSSVIFYFLIYLYYLDLKPDLLLISGGFPAGFLKKISFMNDCFIKLPLLVLLEHPVT